MKMEMMPLSVWTQYLWRGGGNGRVAARPGWGQSVQVGQSRGIAFPFSSPAGGEAHRLLEQQDSRGGG